MSVWDVLGTAATFASVLPGVHGLAGGLTGLFTGAMGMQEADGASQVMAGVGTAGSGVGLPATIYGMMGGATGLNGLGLSTITGAGGGLGSGAAATTTTGMALGGLGVAGSVLGAAAAGYGVGTLLDSQLGLSDRISDRMPGGRQRTAVMKDLGVSFIDEKSDEWQRWKAAKEAQRRDAARVQAHHAD
jgi:hypothetical protein